MFNNVSNDAVNFEECLTIWFYTKSVSKWSFLIRFIVFCILFIGIRRWCNLFEIIMVPSIPCCAWRSTTAKGVNNGRHIWIVLHLISFQYRQGKHHCLQRLFEKCANRSHIIYIIVLCEILYWHCSTQLLVVFPPISEIRYIVCAF